MQLLSLLIIPFRFGFAQPTFDAAIVPPRLLWYNVIMNAKQYHKLLQDLCQIVSEGVHIINADGITIVYNEAMSALEKITREEVLGNPFREVFSNIPEDESTVTRALKHQLETKSQTQTYLNKYGKEITTINSTVPVFDDSGSLIAAIEVSRDITNIKTLSNAILDLRGGSRSSGAPEKSDALKHYTFRDIIGKSPSFANAARRAKQAAKSSATVLIYGETGTGKELFAQSVHYESARKRQPFLAQNCAALPESLLEGILFGTVKGGFTGAIDRQGLFEQASGGTLLLDEISAMPYALQSKLLRVLQENYIRRIGATKDIPVDVRIIATVNEDPKKLVEKGTLRKDLFYRLKVIEIDIPPLRERPDDIPVLAEAFLEKYNRAFDKQVWMLSDSARDALLAHDYPGNVRELENIIMSAVALAGPEHALSREALRVDRESAKPDKKAAGFDSPGGAPLGEYLAGIEKEIILTSLAENGGNISRTAARLGMGRQLLQYKLKKYNATPF